MKVLNFGSCNIDYTYKVEHFVIPGETLSAAELDKFPGGKGLNQSLAAARAGVDVCHAGCIGTDGVFLKEILEQSGVNTSYLEIKDEPTGHAIIQIDESGENCIILYGGANQKISKKYIDTVLKNFSQDDYLVLQNEISNIEYIIEKAYDKRMKIILNPSPFDESLLKIDLGKIHTLILNKVEAGEFAKTTDIAEIEKYFLEKFNKLKVVLTLGSKGSVYFDKKERYTCPIYPVDVVDTTSAGDTFTGYYISGLINNINIDESLFLASVAAGLAVSKKGAAPSIPKLNEVVNALNKWKRRK